MRSFFAADDALLRADSALARQVDESNERRLMTEGVVHFDHWRRRGISILCGLARRLA
ncbi:MULTISPECIES: hypothetical protein [Caballeronia]|uniref:hypothetical protein n=1 Tax=Caballeronia TaxID=1827195 RepID=UPI00031B792D|nr:MULTISPECIES: hypothetical protein [unclassified Caballeronia]MCE4541347.1 hypothetical protein [Caballeronia sp. PC1]MCE4569609.1 hypothetical protein [Caballeronia sp. CLC5]